MARKMMARAWLTKRCNRMSASQEALRHVTHAVMPCTLEGLTKLRVPPEEALRLIVWAGEPSGLDPDVPARRPFQLQSAVKRNGEADRILAQTAHATRRPHGTIPTQALHPEHTCPH